MKKTVLFFLSLLPLMACASESKQLLKVEASHKHTSQAQMWQLRGKKWEKYGEVFVVTVGRNGTTGKDLKREGDGKTPEGLYNLTKIFGKNARTDLKMPFVQITPEDKWIDDPDHADYNKWIRGETTAKSFETLLRTDQQYDNFIVVDYNMDPIVPGRGSAIFTHIWKEPGAATAGCVAMERNQLEVLLKWLDPDQKPKILIGNP